MKVSLTAPTFMAIVAVAIACSPLRERLPVDQSSAPPVKQAEEGVLHRADRPEAAGVFVSQPRGMISLTALTRQAEAYLTKRYKSFSPQRPPVAEFYPLNGERSIVILFGGTIGEPFWQVSFDSNGYIRGAQAGITTD